MSAPPSIGAHRSRWRSVLAVALVALLGAGAAYILNAWPSLEDSTVNLRFSLRHAQPAPQLLIVGIDDKTLNTLRRRWPFPRSLDARALDVLHADRAATIVYDVQFTQPTTPAEDLALFRSIARAPGVLLATTNVGPHGETNVLGGAANLAAAHAAAGAANFRANSNGAIQKYSYALGDLKSLGVAAAERFSGRPVRPSTFQHRSAWIDFRGPPGSVRAVSFSDLIRHRVDPRLVAGKLVIIGATSPVLQDLHATSTTTSTGMSGPEVEANTIWTALHGNPLREAPSWLTWLAIVLGAIATPLCSLRVRSLGACALGLGLAAAYAVAAQVAFNAHLILVVTYPLLAAGLGTLGTLIVGYVAERLERQVAARYAVLLEATVEERTAELNATQLEVIHRLAQAAELRDEDTGGHIERLGELAERLARQIGMTPHEAHQLRVACALHDIGKIGVPDRILLKPGRLDDAEHEVIRSHTTSGADILSGSRSALLQSAETVARTHHERWDGTGYPAGLRGEEIPLIGRICAICDVFDALSTRRPYKEPWPFEHVVAEIKRSSGTHFDPQLVCAFLALLPDLRREHPGAVPGPTSSAGAHPSEDLQAPADYASLLEPTQIAEDAPTVALPT
jgi:CHASE2 domain-containing sensor protein